MNHWYLVASLPYLRFGEKPLVNRAAFLAACTDWLAEEELAVLRAVFDARDPADGGVAQCWWNSEVQLRDAVVRVRAKNRSTDPARFIRLHDGFSASIEKMVTDAFTRANPLEQEAELDRARWALAEELALSGPFGFPGVLAFAVKLRIAERWAGLDDAAGQSKVEELIEEVLTEGRKGRQDA
jgi:hypothetical protein